MAMTGTRESLSMPTSTGLVMRGSALLLGALGLVLLFTPAESAAAFGWGEGTAAPSLAAGGLLAVAILDWMGRGAVYGGIFGRPIILANLVLSVTGGFALLDVRLDSPDAGLLGWIPIAILGIHGTAFGLILLGLIGGPGAAEQD